MADFPRLLWSLDSKEAWLDDLEVERATNGTLRGRAYFTAKKKQFELKFVALSNDEKKVLEAHYDAFRLAEFSFTWRDAVTYSVGYPKDAVQIDSLPGGYWTATVKLEQV